MHATNVLGIVNQIPKTERNHLMPASRHVRIAQLNVKSMITTPAGNALKSVVNALKYVKVLSRSEACKMNLNWRELVPTSSLFS